MYSNIKLSRLNTELNEHVIAAHNFFRRDRETPNQIHLAFFSLDIRALGDYFLGFTIVKLKLKTIISVVNLSLKRHLSSYLQKGGLLKRAGNENIWY